jgi:ABC-type uncharacterized transport system substrate-binding protein
MRQSVAALAALVCGFLGVAMPALAHPHVWVSVKAELVYENGAVKAVRHHWLFDEGYSSFAMQGLDTDNDGKLSPAELQPLAKENTDNLAEFGYFTVLKVDGKRVDVAAPLEPAMREVGKQLELSFLLPVPAPVAARRTVYLDVYDPTFFVDFAYADAPDAVRLTNAPQGCAVQVSRPQNKPDQSLAKLSEDYFANANMGLQFASKVFVACP